VRRGALAKSISELASDWLVLTQDIVFLPCFYGIRLWIYPQILGVNWIWSQGGVVEESVCCVWKIATLCVTISGDKFATRDCERNCSKFVPIMTRLPAILNVINNKCCGTFQARSWIIFHLQGKHSTRAWLAKFSTYRRRNINIFYTGCSIKRY
jgi:hypothetical protein